MLIHLLLLSFSPAHAQAEAEEAEIDFQLGADLYGQGRYNEALAYFLASNRLAPNPSVAYNIGRCYAQTGRNAEAFRWFLTAKEGLKDPRLGGVVQTEIDAILPKIAVFEVQSTPPGATVFLDRRELGAVGVTPFQVALEPSDTTRTFLYERDGWTSSSVEVSSPKRGSSQSVTTELTQIVGTLKIEAEDGIAVHQGAPDGPLVCETPCEPRLAPGNWVLYFRKEGYRDGVRQLEITADTTVTTAVQLQPNTGSVVVSASERGALVEIDGKAVGFTPTVVPGVAVGSRTVRVSRRGYQPVERTVDVVTDGQVALEDLELVPINEVTAVSRRAEQVELAPSSVTLISQEELEAFRYPTIYEALRGVRGMAMTYDSIYGSAAVRGLGQAGDYGNRLLVLSDGATLNDAILYQSFISYDGRVDLGGIERIEIVRGPGSVLYGTGAVSGVVNLIGEGLDTPEHASVTVGTFDDHVVRGRGNVHVKLSDEVGFRANVSGATSQGRTEAATLRVGGDSVRLRQYDSFQGATTTGRVWAKDATVQWYYAWRDIGIPAGPAETTLNVPDRNRWIDSRFMTEARFEPQLSDGVRLLTRAYFNRYQYDGYLPYDEDGFTSVEKYVSNGGGVEARVIAEPADQFRIQAGAVVDLTPDLIMQGDDREDVDVEGDVYLDIGGTAGAYQIAAGYAVMDIIPVEAVRITAGARLDYWSTFGAAVSPRLAVVLQPDDGDVVKILAGRAFRAPSQYELQYNAPGIQIRPEDEGLELKPETVWSAELEYSHAFDDVWTGLIAAHGSLADQFIETVASPSVPDAFTTANAEEAVRILGADVEVRRAFRAGWMLSGYYSVLDSRYAESGELVPNVPTHNAGAKMVIPITAPIARVAFRSSLEAPRRIDLEDDETTGWAVVSDLVLSGTVPDRKFDYAVGVYNLFNQRYQAPLTDTLPFRTMPQQGRSLMAEFTLRI